MNLRQKGNATYIDDGNGVHKLYSYNSHVVTYDVYEKTITFHKDHKHSTTTSKQINAYFNDEWAIHELDTTKKRAKAIKDGMVEIGVHVFKVIEDGVQ